MDLPSYFQSFLSDIRPTKGQRDDAKDGHRTLRTRLLADEGLKPRIVSTFLQGSYRRATAVKPLGDEMSDVDVVVVTNLDKESTSPSAAMELFVPFLEKHYKGKYKRQGRSFGITLSYVELDLVITAAPSEAYRDAAKSDAVTTDDTPEDAADWRLVKSWLSVEHRGVTNAIALLEAAKREAEWKLDPLYIPDREANRWDRTHPLAQIQRTWEKNRLCNTHYVNVVKAVKWWRLLKNGDLEYPKGYPVEHLLCVCCPDGIPTVASGITLGLEEIARRYDADAKAKRVPFVPDHGVPEHNVLGRLSGEDFAKFHGRVCNAAVAARKALDCQDECDSADLWRELVGDKFPRCAARSGKGGYTDRKEPTVVAGGRFA